MSSRGRGGYRGRGGGQRPDERKKREAILNLALYVDKSIRVTLQGGRAVTGTLKGYDQLMNLVMDDVVEHYESQLALLDKLTADNEMPERTLGLVVLRGPNVVLISPTDGLAEIENPFA